MENQINNENTARSSEIIQLFNANAQKVLDIGCGSGDLGQIFKNQNKIVWGIEVSERLANIAKSKLDNVLVGRAEILLSQLPDDFFDFVIITDVIENMYDPEKFLTNLKAKLVDNCEIIISVHNFSTWNVIKKLLTGTLEYEESGVFNKKHIRFFTYDSLSSLFNRIELTPLQNFRIKNETEEIPGHILTAVESLGIDIENLKLELSTSQFIFKLVSNKRLEQLSEKFTEAYAKMQEKEYEDALMLLNQLINEYDYHNINEANSIDLEFLNSLISKINDLLKFKWEE